jgi:tetratricopeptide (TPR) repeat protein
MKINRPDKDVFQMAIDARDEGQYLQAISYLDQLINRPLEAQEEPGIYLNVRANIYNEIGSVDEALRDFQASIELLPLSRLASSTYFHCLLDLGHFTRAQEEGRRYLEAIKLRLERTPSVQTYCDTIEAVLKCDEHELQSISLLESGT